jgi:hypothetical protein
MSSFFSYTSLTYWFLHCFPQLILCIKYRFYSLPRMSHSSLGTLSIFFFLYFANLFLACFTQLILCISYLFFLLFIHSIKCCLGACPVCCLSFFPYRLLTYLVSAWLHSTYSALWISVLLGAFTRFVKCCLVHLVCHLFIVCRLFIFFILC